MSDAEPSAASPFFAAHAEQVRRAAERGPVLDLACGRGRHALEAARLGARVLAADRDPVALGTLARLARARGARVQGLRTDLEAGLGIPVRMASCGAILVFRFLYRPLSDAIVSSLRPGGLLLYETFTLRQRELGYGPRNPDFLLAEGELPRLFGGLEILAYEEGLSSGARPEALARLCAIRRRL